MATGETRPLPGTDGGMVPTFSPDGQWVAFVADDQLQKGPSAVAHRCS